MARITLHHEPALTSGEYRRVEIAVTRADGRAITSAYARDFAHRAQSRYDETRVPPGLSESSPNAAPTGALTVLQWTEGWLRQQTYPEADKDLARTRAWLSRTKLAALPLSEVTPRSIAAWLAELRKLPTAKGTTAAPRTVRNIADPVARALRAAVFEGHLAADPFAVLPTDVRPKAVDANPAARRDYRLTRSQAETLLSEPSVEDRWVVLWHLLLLTGARVSEGVALRWCDLVDDRPLRRVVIAEQIHHRTRERAQTKTGAVPEVPCHPMLETVLAWWRRVGWLQEYGREPTRDDLIVPARGAPGRPWGTADGSGGPIWQQDVHRALQRDLTACDLRAHRVHDLRGTFISLLADSGVAGDVAERWTHTPAGRSARHLYLTPSWERQCTEMLKLCLDLRSMSRWTLPEP